MATIEKASISNPFSTQNSDTISLSFNFIFIIYIITDVPISHQNKTNRTKTKKPVVEIQVPKSMGSEEYIGWQG